MRPAPLQVGASVRVEDGAILNCGQRCQLATWVDDGEYWVIEDQGVKITLQPKDGGPNITARKV